MRCGGLYAAHGAAAPGRRGFGAGTFCLDPWVDGVDGLWKPGGLWLVSRKESKNTLSRQEAPNRFVSNNIDDVSGDDDVVDDDDGDADDDYDVVDDDDAGQEMMMMVMLMVMTMMMLFMIVMRRVMRRMMMAMMMVMMLLMMLLLMMRR